jgi:hypothetical protein
MNVTAMKYVPLVLVLFAVAACNSRSSAQPIPSGPAGRPPERCWVWRGDRMPRARRTARSVLAVIGDALRRGLPACGCGRPDLAAAPRPEGSRLSGSGMPPAPESASCPLPPPGPGMVLRPLRAIPRCARASASELGLSRTAWRTEGVPLKSTWRNL